MGSEARHLGNPRRKPSLFRQAAGILLAALVCGLLFNLVMPQGIGLLPPGVAKPMWQAVEGPRALQMLGEGALFIDAREAGDYSKSRLRGALKLPADEVDKLYRFLEPQLAQAPAIVVYGQSVSRFPAAAVAQFLRQQGLAKVYVLEGNLPSLKALGFDVQEVRRGGGGA